MVYTVFIIKTVKSFINGEGALLVAEFKNNSASARNENDLIIERAYARFDHHERKFMMRADHSSARRGTPQAREFIGRVIIIANAKRHEMEERSARRLLDPSNR